MKIIKYILVVFVLIVISVFWFNGKEIPSFERPIPVKFAENLREDYRKLPFTGAHNFRDLGGYKTCLLYTSPSPRDQRGSGFPGWG